MASNPADRSGLRGAALALLLMLASACASATPRSQSAKADFQRAHPCPANDARRGACPGHVIDHIVPLCAGGADHPSNLQWQTIPDAKAKDIEEGRLCRRLRQTALVR